MTTSPILDDKGEGGVVRIAKNISALKENEKELQGKIDDLEKFNRVIVDRELRMKGLKTEVSELKKRLG